MMNRREFLNRSAAAGLAGVLGGLSASAAPGRSPRILLRSSWQTVNIGDIAHTPGVLRLLADHLPEAEVTLWPGNIGDGVEPMLKRAFPDLRIARDQGQVGEAFDRCDFLLHGSGPSLVGQRQVAEWKQKTGKPYGVLGITLGAMNADLRELLDGAEFVYFRETRSLEFAKEQGVKRPVLGFAPDGAFAVDLRDDEKAEEFLKRHELEDGKFICAIPRLRYTPYWRIHGREMSDQERERHEYSEQRKEADHAKLSEALVAYVRETGHKVLVCPEDKSHMAVGKEMIVDRLPADVRGRFVWRPDYWLTDEAVSVYVRSRMLVSMDMHSPIMCVANGIPAIHCRFREQTWKGQMWNDVGLSEWLFDLDEEQDGGRITEAVMGISRDPDGAAEKVAAAMKVVRDKHRAALGVTAEVLKG